MSGSTMPEIVSLNGFHISHSFFSGFERLRKEREHLNRINVFPVPDGDTGNNMVSTLSQIARDLRPSRSVHATFRAMADSAISGARGNSGMIVAQFIYGIYREVGERARLSTAEFSLALRNAVHYAYRAIENPAEGTIITVLRNWTEELHALSATVHDFHELMVKSRPSAHRALEYTKEELAALSKAGVVDAGAQGFVSFLEGILVSFRSGKPVRCGLASREVPGWDFADDGAEDIPVDGDIPFRYCTEVLLETDLADADPLRAALHGEGDSLIVTQGVGKMRIHLHTNDPEHLLSRLRGFGTVLNQKVDDMFRQFQAVHDRAGTVAIVTDSIADIPPFLMDELQIHLVPQRILWGDELYLDRVTMTGKTFYPLLDERKEYPGSSLPDPVSIRAMFRHLAAHYQSIVALPVSDAISGTWNAMRLEAEALRDEGYPIQVVDTRLNSAAQGLVVIESARAAASGAGFNEVVKIAESVRDRTRILVGVSTFKYMVRGGRVSRLKGFVATAMNLKPVITLDKDGKGAVSGKAFSQKGVIRKIIDSVSRMRDEGGIERYAVVHAASPERAAAFAEELEALLGKPPEYIMEISPIVGSHAGKGALAVALETP